MIVIKDMKMPSSCYECPFAKNKRSNDYGSFCECGVLEDYETINLLEHSKHPNCPLVEQESSCNSVVESKLKNPKVKSFDILRFVADNAGLSTFEAIEKAYIMGVSEQEAILDKVRAEVKTMGGDLETISDALEIIDKYKAESEPQESEE